MKNKLYLVIILILSVLGTKSYSGIISLKNQKPEKDSIIITFGNKTRLIIYGENKKELQKIMKYDLNALLTDLQVRLDSSSSDTTYLREELNGNDYLKDKAVVKVEKDHVRIGIRGIHIKDGNTEVTINAKGVEVKDEDESDSSDTEYRRTGKHFYRANRYSSPRKGFNLAVGLNAYGTNEQQWDIAKQITIYVLLVHDL